MTARASDSMFYPLTMCALQIVFMIMIMIMINCLQEVDSLWDLPVP